MPTGFPRPKDNEENITNKIPWWIGRSQTFLHPLKINFLSFCFLFKRSLIYTFQHNSLCCWFYGWFFYGKLLCPILNPISLFQVKNHFSKVLCSINWLSYHVYQRKTWGISVCDQWELDPSAHSPLSTNSPVMNAAFCFFCYFKLSQAKNICSNNPI